MNLNCYTQAKTRRMNEFNFYHNDIIGLGTQGNAVYIKKKAIQLYHWNFSYLVVGHNLRNLRKTTM